MLLAPSRSWEKISYNTRAPSGGVFNALQVRKNAVCMDRNHS